MTEAERTVEGVEVLVISLGSQQAEEEMVQALLTADCCSRVTSLRDPLTQEIMAAAGPEQYIIDLVHNQTVKIVLLDVDHEDTLLQDKSSLLARYR